METLKLIAPLSKKCLICTNDHNSDSEPEHTSVARTSTSVKTTIATSSKITPVNSRNMVTRVLNDSTNQPTKRPKQQRASGEQTKERLSTSKIPFAPQPQTFPSANLLPIPKTHTASLPVSDGKSEKFEFLKTYFETTSKCTLTSWRFKT